MHRRVQFADDIEPLVQFVEETDPNDIVDLTLSKLRDGVTARTILTASALAVTRSSDIPPGHHGGPLHPLVGLHALWYLINRLEGENRFLPVLQHVALCNKHIHHPAMGPYMMLDIEPYDAGGVEATKDAFHNAVNRGESHMADHCILGLWNQIPAVEVLDLLLSVAIPKNVLDDHYFVFPVYTWRAIEWLGQEYMPILMRPVARYTARYPRTPELPEIDAHELMTRPLRHETGDDETETIGRVSSVIAQCSDFTDIPAAISKALADGLSLQGAGEALSIGAAGLFMRSLTGNRNTGKLTLLNLGGSLASAEADKPIGHPLF